MKKYFLHFCTKKNISPLITDNHTGEIFCGLCGVVMTEKMVDRTFDESTYSKDELWGNKRTGAPLKISISNMGNSSVISKKNVDSSGRIISSKNKFHFSRLRLWDSRGKNNAGEKKLIQAFSVLDSIINKLNLSETVREQSAYIYRKAALNNLIRGSSKNSMIAATVYVACKQLEIPRTLDEIAKTVNIRRKTLSHTYSRLVRKLDLKVFSKKVDYTSKVANSIGVDEKTKRLSIKILADAKKENILMGKNPIGLAAGAVYLSGIGTGKNISMAKISKKSNISTVTIRNIVKILRPFASKYIETIEVSI